MLLSIKVRSVIAIRKDQSIQNPDIRKIRIPVFPFRTNQVISFAMRGVWKISVQYIPPGSLNNYSNILWNMHGIIIVPGRNPHQSIVSGVLIQKKPFPIKFFFCDITVHGVFTA